MVVSTRQEMHQHRQIVTGINVDDIEPSLSSVQSRTTMPSAVRSYIFLIHRTHSHRLVAKIAGSTGGRPDRYFAGFEIGNYHAIVHKLDACQAAVSVD
jgi:hypothetical protein